MFWEALSLLTPGSLSVMDATAPAMSGGLYPESLEIASGKLVTIATNSRLLTKFSNGDARGQLLGVQRPRLRPPPHRLPALLSRRSQTKADPQGPTREFQPLASDR